MFVTCQIVYRNLDDQQYHLQPPYHLLHVLAVLRLNFAFLRRGVLTWHG